MDGLGHPAGDELENVLWVVDARNGAAHLEERYRHLAVAAAARLAVAVAVTVTVAVAGGPHILAFAQRASALHKHPLERAAGIAADRWASAATARRRRRPSASACAG